MSAQETPLDPSERDWPSLLRLLRGAGAGIQDARVTAQRLTDDLPDEEICRILDSLTAERARRQEERFETAIAQARADLHAGDLETARADAEAACRVDPFRWEVHQLLGEILERSGDRAGALRRYVTAVHLGWECDEAKQAVRRVDVPA